MKRWRQIGCALLCSFLIGSALARERLVFYYMISSGQQRSAWQQALRDFTRANPDIDLVSTVLPDQQYRDSFADLIEKDKVDVAFWFAGQPLRELARHGQLLPFETEQLKELTRDTHGEFDFDTTRVGGQVYALPVAYYPWGFFYRKSLFARLGLTVPQSWDEFLRTCAALKAAQRTPLAMGVQDGWPAAAWFDFLDLRINGLEFHRRLLRGEESFRDTRVRKVFETWREPLARGYFLADTMARDWSAVLPYFYRSQVGMILMGGFVAAKFPPAIAADVGFFPFPRVAPGMPQYEEGPLDVLVQPASGIHREAARRFLAFFAHGDALRQLNAAGHTVSPQGRIGTPKGGREEGGGGTFFFDRDANPELVGPAYQGFRQFAAAPFDIDAAIRAVDQRAGP